MKSKAQFCRSRKSDRISEHQRKSAVKPPDHFFRSPPIRRIVFREDERRAAFHSELAKNSRINSDGVYHRLHRSIRIKALGAWLRSQSNAPCGSARLRALYSFGGAEAPVGAALRAVRGRLGDASLPSNGYSSIETALGGIHLFQFRFRVVRVFRGQFDRSAVVPIAPLRLRRNAALNDVR